MTSIFSRVKRVLVEDEEKSNGMRRIIIETETGDHEIFLNIGLSGKRINIVRRRNS